jgi:glycosyltransferase involved in cell wall biosynthesis
LIGDDPGMSSDPLSQVLVSVVIPSIGRRRLLGAALASLERQTLDRRSFEVIVVDDESPETYEWLPSYVRLLKRPTRGGPGGARNTGIAAASGRFVAFTDDDCLVPSNWLVSLMNAFQRFPSVSAVGGPLLPSAVHMKAAPARLEHMATMEYFRRMHVDPLRDEVVTPADASPAWGTNNLAWRMPALRSLDGFAEGTTVSEDRDLALRAGAAGLLAAFIPLVVHHNRPFTWADLWQRYESGPVGAGGRLGILLLARALVRLPVAVVRDLALLRRGDLGVFFAALVRDFALSAGAVRAALGLRRTGRA